MEKNNNNNFCTKFRAVRLIRVVFVSTGNRNLFLPDSEFQFQKYFNVPEFAYTIVVVVC